MKLILELVPTYQGTRLLFLISLVSYFLFLPQRIFYSKLLTVNKRIYLTFLNFTDTCFTKCKAAQLNLFINDNLSTCHYLLFNKYLQEI